MGIINLSSQQSDFNNSENRIINGDFRIWQRAVPNPVVNDTYGPDRWKFFHVTYTPTITKVTDNSRVGNFLRIQDSGIAGISTSYSIFGHLFEDVKIYSNKSFVIAFNAKVGSGSLNIGVEFGQYFGVGSTDTAVNTFVGNATITTTEKRFVFIVNLPDVSSKDLQADNHGRLYFWLAAGSNFDSRTGFSSGSTPSSLDFYISDVDVFEGTFARNYVAKNLLEEKLLCYRYFNKSYPLDIDPGTVYNPGRIKAVRGNVNSVETGVSVMFPVSMRVAPVVTIYSPITGDSGKINDGVERAASAVGITEDRMFITYDVAQNGAFAEQVHYAADSDF